MYEMHNLNAYTLVVRATHFIYDIRYAIHKTFKSMYSKNSFLQNISKQNHLWLGINSVFGLSTKFGFVCVSWISQYTKQFVWSGVGISMQTLNVCEIAKKPATTNTQYCAIPVSTYRQANGKKYALMFYCHFSHSTSLRGRLFERKISFVPFVRRCVWDYIAYKTMAFVVRIYKCKKILNDLIFDTQFVLLWNIYERKLLYSRS